MGEPRKLTPADAEYWAQVAKVPPPNPASLEGLMAYWQRQIDRIKTNG